jgi:hypothetical protein
MSTLRGLLATDPPSHDGSKPICRFWSWLLAPSDRPRDAALPAARYFALFLEESTLFERLLVAFVDAVESAVETAASAIRRYFFQELFEFLLGELLG